MWKTYWVWVVRSMLAAILLIGAGGPVSGQEQKVSGQEQKLKLEYAMLASYQEKEAWEQVVDMFEHAYPQIEIETIWWTPDEYYSQLRRRMAAKTLPDISRIVIEEYQGFVSQDAFLDLTPYIETEMAHNPEFTRQMADYFPMLLDALKYKGRFYGLPADWNDAVIFYNKDLFDEAGLPYPSPEWTVEEFVEIAEKLTKDSDGDGRIDQYGYLVTGDWFDCICPWIWTFGGHILTEDWTASRLNELETRQAFEFLNKLVNTYQVSPPPSGSPQFKVITDFLNLFLGGKVAMIHSGRYMVQTFRKMVMFDWDVQQQPRGPGGQRGVPYGVASLSVAATTKHPQEAFEFVRFASSQNVVQRFNELGNSIPVLQSVVARDDFKHPTLPPKNQYVMIDALEYARLIPSPPQNAAVIDIAISELYRMLIRQISPQEAAQNMHEQVTNVLQK